MVAGLDLSVDEMVVQRMFCLYFVMSLVYVGVHGKYLAGLLLWPFAPPVTEGPGGPAWQQEAGVTM